jgi:hypothetical protein
LLRGFALFAALYLLVWAAGTFGSLAVLAQAFVRLRRGTPSRRAGGVLLMLVAAALVLSASRVPTMPLPALAGMMAMGIAAVLILRRPSLEPGPQRVRTE